MKSVSLIVIIGILALNIIFVLINNIIINVKGPLLATSGINSFISLEMIALPGIYLCGFASLGMIPLRWYLINHYKARLTVSHSNYKQGLLDDEDDMVTI